MGSDHFAPKPEKDLTIENTTTLFKGISNGKHVLKLVSDSKKVPEITMIKVYKPLIPEIPYQ